MKRIRQVPEWSLLTHCAHYETDCTIMRRADVQIRQEKILALQLEMILLEEEMRRDTEKMVRLEASLLEVLQRKKTLEDI